MQLMLICTRVWSTLGAAPLHIYLQTALRRGCLRMGLLLVLMFLPQLSGLHIKQSKLLVRLQHVMMFCAENERCQV